MSRATHDDGHFNGAAVLDWREPMSSGRVARAAACSVGAHILIAIVVLSMPAPPVRSRNPVTFDVRKAVPLVLPSDLRITQRDPNPAKAKEQLDVRSALPTQPSPPKVFQPPAPVGGPELEEPPKPLPAVPDVDVQVAVNVPQVPAGRPSIPVPVKPPEKILEDVTPAPDFGPRANPRIVAPSQTPEEIARSISPGGPPGGGVSNGAGSEPASLGEMQLLSDPQGVDFKPYLLHVLTTVRQKWFAIIPPEARTGRPGLVTVQFIIDRQGHVPKLVIANPSGTLAFDRAAVAAISASYPFSPLPADYRGQEIRLQLAFSYNVKTVR